MTQPFSRDYQARWADMDFNQHMSNSEYLAYAEQTRMLFLDSQGWSMQRPFGSGIPANCHGADRYEALLCVSWAQCGSEHGGRGAARRPAPCEAQIASIS